MYNDNDNDIMYNARQKAKKMLLVDIIVFIVLFVCFIIFINSNQTCRICGNKAYKDFYCKEHYNEMVVKGNLKDVLSGKKDWSNALRDVFDKVLR